MSLQLDDLLALNEEVAALLQVGVAIPLGLETVSPDPQVAIGRINAQLVDRVAQGQSLEATVDELSPTWPPVYAAAIQAGMRCDDLSVSLRSIQRHASRLANCDRRAAATFVYPLIVVSLASVLLVCFCLFVAPALVDFWDGMQLPLIGFVGYLDSGSRVWPLIAGGFGVAVLAVWWGWYRLQRRDRRTSLAPRWLDRLPVMRSVTHDYDCAQLAELLAELTARGLPLADSLRLAGGTVASEPLRKAVWRQAEGARADTASERRTRDHLPPFLQWLVDQGTQLPGLVDLLRLAAATYRERGDRRARRVRSAIPMVACLCVAGGITLLYALMLFVPLVQTLRQLAS